MDFGSLLSVAQKNAKTSNHSSERSKFYSTKFEPPKKVTKEKKLSDGIKKFLAQKEEEKREDQERKRKEYEELMALRSDRDKNKIRKMLKVTKSANRSVLEDAVNSTDTAVTLQGPEQPDEDDYGYTSIASDALYKNLMEKYKSLPEDKKFSKSSLSGSKNADLMSTKNRVRDAIMREREDERSGHRKRSHTSTSSGDNHSSSINDQKQRCRKNLYDPRAEREAEERKRKEVEDEKRQKMKNKRPPPPVMDFQNLLKLAEAKQHQPIQIEVPQKTKEPERLLTGKEKREMEQKKKELEERERRRSALLNKTPHTNGEQRSKSDAQPTNGRIPKLNASNTPSSTKSVPHSADSRKPSMKEPIRPASKPIQSMRPSSSTPQSNVKRSVEMKSKIQTNGTPTALKQPTKPIDSRNVKPREFPPRDVIKTREFPPRDVVKSREFPPRDMLKSREFPPRDMQHNHKKSKPTAASKRRILEDSEDEDEYDSEMDDFIDDDDEEINYSSAIKNIFGYDKSRYRDEDDDVDNMESTFAQQQREEFISKKIGIMEDLEDMRQEEEEKKRKAQKRRRP
ncbi:protein SPT2 homolog [Contarinia nasturtii]|uniref:protein SPT2 homolog n=1 Tax=Contarinia nasturtii TaxID=265458 RepID=UPI0012D4B3B7|nr:protein SPT2 homolog [Contarinia nasturtii]